MSDWEERMAAKARGRERKRLETAAAEAEGRILTPRDVAHYLSTEDQWRFEEGYIRDQVAKTTRAEVEARIPIGCACPGPWPDHMICPCILQAEIDNRVLDRMI